MLRIAICDDEAAMIETVRAITAHFLRTQGVDGEIQCYSRNDTLRDDLDDGSFYDLFSAGHRNAKGRRHDPR